MSKFVPTWKTSGYSALGLVTRIRSLIVSEMAFIIGAMNGLLRAAWRGLRALVPSRRFLARSTCLVVGSGLVVFSLLGFASGEVLQSFIILPIGYAIAVCFWVLPWKSSLTAAQVAQWHSNEILVPAPAPSRRVSLAGGTRSKAGTPTRVNVSFKPRGFSFKWNRQRTGEIASSTSVCVAKESVQLVCGPCGKQFRVRGEGQLGGRLIPCPQCGSTLGTNDKRSGTDARKDPSWVPIVSVVCKHCRGLIDVPYSSLGKSVACPRCESELPIPAMDGQKAGERTFSQMAKV
jgi:hypothetical protein